ncbi:MAG: CvpA family protein [Phycisphaerae bacterium]
MLLILLVTLLILGIAFYQVLQGLYSALIMLLLTIVAAMLAFNLYLPISLYLLEYMTVYTRPVILVSCFALILFALRLVFDRFLGSNVVLGTWADRIGGGVFGLMTGMILTGILTIAIQMLPFNESILTYRPYNEYLERGQRLHPFRPDEFTLGLMSHLSSGSMSGNANFGDAHGDLLFREFCARNSAGMNGGKRAPENSFEDLEFYTSLPSGINADEVPTYHLAERGPQKLIIARTTFSRELADPDGWWRIPGTHVPLTALEEDGNGEAYTYYPVAYLTGRVQNRRGDFSNEGEWELHTLEGEDGRCKLAELIVARKLFKEQDSLTIDWVYSIRQEHKPNGVTLRRTTGIFTTRIQQYAPSADDSLARPPGR